MDETMDPKPHPHLPMGEHAAHEAALGSPAARGESLSIWFFVGILTLGYGVILVAQAGLEHFRLLGQHPPTTILANLHPTFWWGLVMTLFGAFFTLKFRPGKG